MKRENYSIVFSSLTGNTKKLADVIHETLPKNECDYFGTIEAQIPQSKLLYVGFWTDKGNADHKILRAKAQGYDTYGLFRAMCSHNPTLVS